MSHSSTRLCLVFWLLLVALLVAGAGHDKPANATYLLPAAEREGAASEEEAIRRTYEILEARDLSRFPDSLEPAARSDQAPSSALSVAVGLSALPADILARLSFVDMTYELARTDRTWAEVRVRGLIRNTALGTEVPLDAIEIAHQVQGRWYTSLPEIYTQTAAGQDYAALIRRLNAEGCH